MPSACRRDAIEEPEHVDEVGALRRPAGVSLESPAQAHISRRARPCMSPAPGECFASNSLRGLETAICEGRESLGCVPLAAYQQE